VQVSGGATSTAARRGSAISANARLSRHGLGKGRPPDPRGEALQKQVRDMGIRGLRSARVSDVYTITGDITRTAVERICSELLADTPVQDYSIGVLIEPRIRASMLSRSYTTRACRTRRKMPSGRHPRLGYRGVESVKTAKRYYLAGC